ncbi:MAG: HRDC domain-containing protein [Myxococcota bacterium]
MSTIVDAAEGLTRPVGKRALARALRGSRAKELRRGGLLKLPQHGALSFHNDASIVAAIERLLQDGHLERRGEKYPTVWLAGRPVRAGARTTPSGAGKAPTRSKRAPSNQSDLMRALDNYRKRTARALKWKSYMVFHHKAIVDIDRLKPASIEELAQVYGLGPAKVEQFGEAILALVSQHRS